MHSFLQKLTLLFFSTILLVGGVAHSLWNVYEEQRRINQEILIVNQTRSHLEQLRTQLSLFLQYKDQESFEQLFLAQRRFEEQVQRTAEFNHAMNNVKRMLKTLRDLLTHEQSLPAANDKAKELIHSRYNMIVISMEEELTSLQQTVLEKRLGQLTQVVSNSGLSLVFFTVLVSVITFMILKRYKRGCETLQHGFNQLSQGDLDSQIKPKGIDEEFVTIAEHFNAMKQSLSQITVTREQLELEVLRQTAELRAQKEQLMYLSEIDPLTGLKNRRAFLNAVSEAATKANRSGAKLALLFIDLNKFKEINDTYGHDAGDAILCVVAERMRECFRSSDILGRLGGDEYVICLDLLTDYSGVLSKAEQFVEMVSQPIAVNDRQLSVGASIGISCYPDQTSSISELVKLADEDMYHAKSQPEGGIVSRFLDQPAKLAHAK